ncbi:MAG: 50S ribosomal protein L6 [Dehalococcoidia bacterium]|nr:50S ribosomal protein L6 [Dehalococcoidia bacterium]
MSRIGLKPVPVPSNVQVSKVDHTLTVKGPLGTLTQEFLNEVEVAVEKSVVKVSRNADDKFSRSVHGLTRALINNMVIGVTQGYKKELEIVGTGYRVAQAGDKLNFQLGFSHPVEYAVPTGIKVAIAGQNRVTITGSDKQQVGQVAAELRAIRPPEPYKGKGVRYAGEVIKLKPGKAAAGKK